MNNLYRLPTLTPSQGTLASLGVLVVNIALLAFAAGAASIHVQPPPRFLLRLPAYPNLPVLLTATAILAAALLRRRRSSLLLAPLAITIAQIASAPICIPSPAILHSTAAQIHALLLALGTAVPATVFALTALRAATNRSALYGSSRWARRTDLLSTDTHPTPHSIVLAGTPFASKPMFLYDHSDQHALVFAPPGTGKTTALAVPTLLTWRGSAIVFDPKGELYQLTAGYRATLGEVILFAPTEPSRTATWNPLLQVRRDIHDVKDAQLIAHAIVASNPEDAASQFWDNSARALTTGLILHVLYAERQKTLARLSSLLNDPEAPIEVVLKRILHAQHDPHLERGWKTDSGVPTPTHTTVAEEARGLLNADSKVRASVISTAQSHLRLYADPILAHSLHTSEFIPADLLEDVRTLYICVPPGEIARLAPTIRILILQTLQDITSGMLWDTPKQRQRLLFLLDEFPLLGRMDPLATSLAYLRGYGVRFLLAAQSLGQLRATYGVNQSIVANCPIQVAFAPGDIETADLLSRLCGQSTVNLAGESRTWGGFLPKLSTSERDHQRPLATADELRRLPPEQCLVFRPRTFPLLARRIRYFEHPETARRASIPPPDTTHRRPRTSHWPPPAADAETANPLVDTLAQQ